MSEYNWTIVEQNVIEMQSRLIELIVSFLHKYDDTPDYAPTSAERQAISHLCKAFGALNTVECTARPLGSEAEVPTNA